MSDIKNTQLDGDLSLGRNLSMGGDLACQGNASLGGDLKIRGWLEAPNVKHVNKGMFSTEENLRETYPVPRNGWWAIVGDELPGPIYVGWKGKWIPTGKTGGNPTIDSENFERIIRLTDEDIDEITGQDSTSSPPASGGESGGSGEE